MPCVWTSPRGRAWSAATSTSPWKRTASSAKTSASRNAVTPNAATANSARRSSVTVRQPPELLQPLGVEPAGVLGEVGEREIAEVLDECRALGVRAPAQVLVSRQRARVHVETPGATADELTLA